MHNPTNCVHDNVAAPTRPRASRLSFDRRRDRSRDSPGAAAPGERLPTHRLLADLLGVNVSTVTRAYREAARRRLVDGETGRGTFVLARSAEAALFAFDNRPAADLIDLSTNTRRVKRATASWSPPSLRYRAAKPRPAALPHPGDWLVHRSAPPTGSGRASRSNRRQLWCVPARSTPWTPRSPCSRGRQGIAAEALSIPDSRRSRAIAG